MKNRNVKADPFVEHEVDGILKIKNGKYIYLAGGCFWGTEHYFKQIEGVMETSVGFANGHTPSPTYKEVYTDTTGYAETVHVKYNPDVVSLEFLLQMFFKAIDPTSLNKQGHDEGTRYRTGIYRTLRATVISQNHCLNLQGKQRNKSNNPQKLYEL